METQNKTETTKDNTSPNIQNENPSGTPTDVKSPSNEENLQSKNDDIVYRTYTGEKQLPGMIALIERDLSEPYSVYTYRYFLNNWPNLCLLAYVKSKDEPEGERCIGVIVSKVGPSKKRN